MVTTGFGKTLLAILVIAIVGIAIMGSQSGSDSRESSEASVATSSIPSSLQATPISQPPRADSKAPASAGLRPCSEIAGTREDAQPCAPDNKSQPGITAAAPITDPPPASQHEQRLAELHKKLEAVQWRMALEMEHSKWVYQQLHKLASNPFPDPGEKQDLFERADKQEALNKKLMAEKDAIDAEIARENGAPLSSTTPAKMPESTAASVASPTPSPNDPVAQALLSERARLARAINSAEAMLAATGLADRAKIYCRSQIPATPMSSGSLDELVAAHSKREQESPATQQEEVKRQYQLQADQEVLAAAYDNFQTCVSMHSFYGQPLPSNEDESKTAAAAKARIAEIDQQLSKQGK